MNHFSYSMTTVKTKSRGIEKIVLLVVAVISCSTRQTNLLQCHAFTTTTTLSPSKPLQTLPSSLHSIRSLERRNQELYQHSQLPTKPTTTLSSPQPLISSNSALWSSPTTGNNNEKNDSSTTTTAAGPTIWEKINGSLSQSAATHLAKKYDRDIAPITHSMSLLTLIRTLVPSIVAGIIGFLAFPALALWLCTFFNDAGVFTVLSQDSSQFVQNFLTVAGLLFSILVGQTYYFMYQQQEMVYYALFNEVTEAKSLLEQVALVSQGRSMYPRVLQAMSTYVESDLKKLQSDPAVLLSSRPMDDPLETIMYLTSVGVPSTVYETVRSLRQARAQRLGALQRKLPSVHMLLLWILGIIELVSFPLLGAGTQTLGGYKLLTIEGCLFGVMTTGIVLTLRVVGELWRPAGGAYNVDNVLKVMVRGLEQELKARMQGKSIKAQRNNYPSSPSYGGDIDDKDSSTAVPKVVKVPNAFE